MHALVLTRRWYVAFQLAGRPLTGIAGRLIHIRQSISTNAVKTGGISMYSAMTWTKSIMSGTGRPHSRDFVSPAPMKYTVDAICASECFVPTRRFVTDSLLKPYLRLNDCLRYCTS